MAALLDLFLPSNDESLIGYLRQLALRNGYNGWHDLVAAFECRPTKRAIDQHALQLFIAFGFPDEQHEHLSNFLTTSYGNGAFNRAGIEPICTECLREHGYQKRQWSHSLVVACPDHRCLLIDQCPNCHAVLDDTRRDIATCICGFDLRHATPAPCTSIQSWISARVVQDMRPYDGIEEIGIANDYKSLAELLFQLAVRIDPETKIRLGGAPVPKTVADSIALLDPIADILCDVRPRLAKHISDRFAAGDQEAFSLSGRLGPWYHMLNGLCQKTGAFPVIWEVFSDAVFDHFDGQIRGQVGLTPSPGKARQHLGVTEAAKLIGVSKPLLVNAIRQKLIKTRTGREGTNYVVTMISRDECLSVMRQRAAWVSRSKACHVLGVSRGVLQHLINADLVTLDTNWERSLFKAGPVQFASVEEILQRLDAPVYSIPAQRALKLEQINARRTVDKKALVQLYQAIFTGAILPVGRDNAAGLSAFSFSEKEVSEYLGSVRLEHAMTLPQLAEATGWKYESVSTWAHDGLLDYESVQLQGRPVRIVTSEALARFRQEWIPVSDIANAGNSKGSAVSRHLENQGVRICGKTVQKNGATRGGIIRLSDLVHLAGLAKRTPVVADATSIASTELADKGICDELLELQASGDHIGGR